jgi:hypothetical protein
MAEYSSEWPLQVAIYDALVADAALMVQVSAVYDFVPANTSLNDAPTMPYIVIGDMTALDWDSKTFTGEELTLTLHIWSEQPGWREVKQIFGHIKRILHDTLLDLSGDDHTSVLLRREFEETIRDPDNVTRHGVVRLRAIVQKN